MEQNSTIVKIDKDLEDLIPGYLENRRRDVISIREALKKNDLDTIRIVGHSMKGSGGGYGFDRITEIGKLIEESAKNMDKEGIIGHIDGLSRYLDHIEIVYE